MNETVDICKKCILPNEFLGIEINSKGFCNFCADPSHNNVNWSKIQINDTLRRNSLLDWNDVVKNMKKNHGEQKYDCVIGYSGGKDSTALLDLFVNEYGLHPLAVIADTGFMTDIAKENMKKTLKKININHILIEEATPTFNTLYKWYFFNHNSNEICLTKYICDVCSDLIHSIVVQEAIERRIKKVIFGYSPDQIRRYFYEIPQNDILEWKPDLFSNEPFNGEDRKWYVDRNEISMKDIPRILLPYHAIDYDENEIIKLVESKNLIEVGRADPLLTNCHVVKAAILYDFYRYGGIPYALQYAELIRQQDTEVAQKRSRKNWLRLYKRTGLSILNGTFNQEGMNKFFKNIGMSKETLLENIKTKRNKDPTREQILRNIELIRTKVLR